MSRTIRTSTDIGRLVREARLRRGLTQAEVASALGVTQKWISHIEGGKDTAPVGSVLRLLNALDVCLTTMRNVPDDANAAFPSPTHHADTGPSIAGKTGIDAVLAAHRDANTARTNRPKQAIASRKNSLRTRSREDDS